MDTQLTEPMIGPTMCVFFTQSFKLPEPVNVRWAAIRQFNGMTTLGPMVTGRSSSLGVWGSNGPRDPSAFAFELQRFKRLLHPIRLHERCQTPCAILCLVLVHAAQRDWSRGDRLAKVSGPYDTGFFMQHAARPGKNNE